MKFALKMCELVIFRCFDCETKIMLVILSFGKSKELIFFCKDFEKTFFIKVVEVVDKSS